jgi:hypothetical protein
MSELIILHRILIPWYILNCIVFDKGPFLTAMPPGNIDGLRIDKSHEVRPLIFEVEYRLAVPQDLAMIPLIWIAEGKRWSTEKGIGSTGLIGPLPPQVAVVVKFLDVCALS